MAQDCEFVSGLDEISNGGRSRSEEINNAILATTHKAAELGADSIEILDADFVLFKGGVVKANAYKCR
jgi:predicted metal-dependent HD superfamily phosphohydrolase|tara:strand:- start:235 stop:438 length:204 start_codon:yes stop_codon:yes gene_type:complete